MPDPDSGDLLLVAARDDAAFRRILGRWRYPVYALFERTREPSAAIEAAVDVFVQLYQTAPSYGPEIAFNEWLFTIAWRRIKDEPAATPPTIPAQRIAESAAARTALLRAAAASLPPAERAAFLLTRMAGLPLGTAAAAIGIPEDDLRPVLVRALEALRLRLQPLLALPGTLPRPGGS